MKGLWVVGILLSLDLGVCLAMVYGAGRPSLAVSLRPSDLLRCFGLPDTENIQDGRSPLVEADNREASAIRAYRAYRQRLRPARRRALRTLRW